MLNNLQVDLPANRDINMPLGSNLWYAISCINVTIAHWLLQSKYFYFLPVLRFHSAQCHCNYFFPRYPYPVVRFIIILCSYCRRVNLFIYYKILITNRMVLCK